MKKGKNIKILIITIILIMLSMCFFNIVNAADINYYQRYLESNNKYLFNIQDILKKYAAVMTGGEMYPYEYDVTAQMVEDKTAVPLTERGFDDDKLDSMDTSNMLGLVDCYKNNENETLKKILSDLEKTLGHKKDTIDLRVTFYKTTEAKDGITHSIRTTEKAEMQSIIEDFKEELEKEILEIHSDVTPEEVKQEIDALNQEFLESYYMARRLVRLDAIMPDGAEYTLVIAGKNYERYNWFMVRTKEAPKEEPPVQEEPKKEFKTDLSYIAIVDGNNVDGTLKDGTYYPNYDRTKVEKDANVTAKITSTTKTDIVKINGVDLNPDGTKNSLGWYYADKSDKTVIVKDYPFDKVDNTTDNGIVIEKDLELTSIDGLKDKETVSIEWPFRIIDLTQTPEKIDDKTEKTTVTITTNLPMEEEKLPDGWKFTDDEEGKTQHRIYKEFYKKDGNKEEDVVVIANNRDDKDNTQVKVVWPKEQPKEEPKEELPEKIPQTGKNFGLVIAIISLAGVSAITYRKFRK